MIAGRIHDGVVLEVFDRNKASLEGRFHPDFIAGLIDVPEHVTPGMVEINGEFVEPPPEPEQLPAWVYPFQARTALLANNLLDAVNDAVANAGPEAQIAWEYAIEIHRNSPLIETLGAAIGLTAEQIDRLFIEAQTY